MNVTQAVQERIQERVRTLLGAQLVDIISLQAQVEEMSARLAKLEQVSDPVPHRTNGATPPEPPAPPMKNAPTA